MDMKSAETNIQLSISFNQIVELVQQLSTNEKIKLRDVLNNDHEVLTHFASEKALAKDWLLPEEEEAWKDL